MSIDLQNEYGHVTISNEVIATIAGGAAVECYGVVGMASQKQLRDGIAEILRRENFSKGVIVRQENNQLHIDMYVIVSYGTKISEVAHNVQNQVKYTLNKTLGLSIDSVNIFIQGVRVTGEA
ncbi:MAG: Asp23/Gls24 family envelope stress response protein [Bacillaceae bacterium]|nr:Asp23/Gls24 family envelope stress response protein [Bacillaceae bacterium]